MERFWQTLDRVARLLEILRSVLIVILTLRG